MQKVTKEEITAVFPGAKASVWGDEETWKVEWEYKGHKISGFIDEDYVGWYSELNKSFTYEPYFEPHTTLEKQHKQITSDIAKWDYAFA